VLGHRRIWRLGARLGLGTVTTLLIMATSCFGAADGSGRSILWVHYRGEIITIAAVLVLQTLLIFILLVERRRRGLAEAESRRRLLQVAHLNRAATVSALSASITHEINQPLGAILSNAEAAEELLRSDRFDRGHLAAILADIRRDDQRAAGIIRSMRGLLRRGEIVSRQFDLNDAIRDTLAIIGPEARSRRVVLAANQESGILLVHADPMHVQQVVLNLAINGMDAMPDGPPASRTLEIETAQAGDGEAMVTVSDAGTGIPEDELKNIFEPFYTTKPQGTGLGLSIAHAIVQTCRGRIWAENRPNGGAVFRFTLPLVRTRPDERA
jgi:signal transduction histidine kinase